MNQDKSTDHLQLEVNKSNKTIVGTFVLSALVHYFSLQSLSLWLIWILSEEISATLITFFKIFSSFFFAYLFLVPKNWQLLYVQDLTIMFLHSEYSRVFYEYSTVSIFQKIIKEAITQKHGATLDTIIMKIYQKD